jgi:hypothetical protein
VHRVDPEQVDGYYAPAAPAVPAVPAARSRRRRHSLPLLALVPAVLLGLLGLLVLRGARADAEWPLHAVAGPAPAEYGWSPSYLDDHGRPARWDPCRPLHFVVLSAYRPATGRADLTAALARLSAASGLTFVDDGDTDEVPSRSRSAYQPARYGKRWAPLLIGWLPPSATDLGLGAGIQGLTVAVAVPGPDGGSLVTGQVALDGSRPLPAGFGPGVTDGEVLLHELAHAVGLGHVLDPTQVMYPQTTNSESTYGAGDRAGLAAVGRPAGCHRAPAPYALRTRVD